MRPSRARACRWLAHDPRACLGSAEIAAVDVSCDGGKSQHAAEITGRHERGWHSFAIDWQPPGPGEYVLQCRAIDASGETQPADGARNAIYSATVTVA